MYKSYTNKKGLLVLFSIVDDENMLIHVIQRYADGEPDEAEALIPLAPLVEATILEDPHLLIPMPAVTFISEMEKIKIQFEAIRLIEEYTKVITG